MASLSDLNISVGWLICAQRSFPDSVVTSEPLSMGTVKGVGANNVYQLDYRVVFETKNSVQITIGSTVYLLVKECDVIFSLAPLS